MKTTFRADTFRSHTFRSGTWTGVGAAAGARTLFWRDTFDRGDSGDVGGLWSVLAETGTGWEIEANALHMEQQSAIVPSTGTLLHPTLIDCLRMEVRLTVRFGIASSSKTRLTLYARSPSALTVAGAYSLSITGVAGEAELRRAGTLVGTVAALEIGKSNEEVRWELEDLPHKVQHKVWSNGVLLATIDDEDPSRLTQRGYVGIAGLTDFGTAGGGDAYSIDVLSMVVDTDRILARVSGFHQALNSYAARLSGLHDAILRTFRARLSGAHRALTGFEARLSGAHEARQEFGPRLSGRHNAILESFAARLSGKHGVQIPIEARLSGQHHAEDAAAALWEIYIGVDGDPDLTAAPDHTTATLPFSLPAFTAGTDNRVVVRRRNVVNLLSLNIAHHQRTIDGTGADITPPLDPTETLVEPYTGGTVRVRAHYVYAADVPGELAADTWLIYLRSNGTDPDPAIDTPTEVAMVLADAEARLDWTSEAFSEGADVRVIVRTRRSGATDADSLSVAVNSAVATLEGPEVQDGGAGAQVPR